MRVLRRLALLLVGGATISAAAASLGGLHWALDLASHFRLPVGLAALVGALGCLPAKEWWGAVAGLVVVGWAVVGGAPLWTAGLNEPAPGQGRLALGVLTFNVQMDHPEPERVVDWLAQSEADVLVIQEVDPRWAALLEPALEAWPHRHLYATPDYFGLAIFSRYRLRAPAVRVASPGTLPLMTLEVDLSEHPDVPPGGGPRSLLMGALHLYPPMLAPWIEANDALVEMTIGVRELRRPKAVLCGDWNLTPWSRKLRGFLAATNLRLGTLGSGHLGTWPAFGPVSGLRLPIDHCMVGSDVDIYGASVGPDLGSDHRPVLLELGI